jgi:hypothetical protein
MTAKSRRRKAQQRLKRSNTNVEFPQPRDVRRPQEDTVRGYTPSHIVIDEARLRSVHLVKEGEGLGYILEVGGVPLHGESEYELVPLHQVDLEDFGVGVGLYYVNDYEKGLLERHREEAVRSEAAPDAATLVERGAEGTSKEPTFFEQLHEVRAIVDEANREVHEVFYEAEIEGVAGATHIVKEDCYCGLNEHHWKDLGEN